MFSQFFLSSFTEAQKKIRLSMPKTNRNTNKQLIVTEKWKTFATYKYCVYPGAIILCSKILRFSDAWKLHAVVDPMKDSNYDRIVIPEKIRKNSSWSATRNIPGWHGKNCSSIQRIASSMWCNSRIRWQRELTTACAWIRFWRIDHSRTVPHSTRKSVWNCVEVERKSKMKKIKPFSLGIL
jgi:hypothetical protein